MAHMMPDPRMSTVHVSATSFPVSSEIELHLNLRGSAGNPVCGPQAMGTVDCIVETPGGRTIRLEFPHTMLANVTCIMKYVVHELGKHKIHVKICGADIKCSPVTVLARPRDREIGTYNPSMNQPHDILLHDNIFLVTNKGNNEVLVLDKHFRPANKFSSAQLRIGKFDPYAIAWTGKSFVVTDLSNRCVVEFQNFIPTRAFGTGTLEKPTGIAAAKKSGHVYVADDVKNCIFVFNDRRECVNVMGGPGSALGQLNSPWFMALNSKGHLVVADFKNHRVQVWNPGNKNAIRIIDVKHQGKTWDCRGIAVDRHDNIYVAVRCGGLFGLSVETVVVYTADGDFLGNFGEGFHYVRNLTIVHEGHKTLAYVVDGGLHRIRAFEM